MTRPSRTRVLGILCTVPLLATAACVGGGAGDESLSGETIRLIIPSSAGGGFDTTMRQLQPALESELDVTLGVENLEGGGFAIGTQAAINAAQDCTTVLFHGVPHLPFSFLTQNVDYTAQDLAPVAGLTVEPGVFRVQDDAPWETLEDLVDDAKENPGEITVSVSGKTSNNFVAMLALQETTGAEFNVVSFDGGGPSRTALVAGDVDVTHAGVFNSLSIDDGTRVLAVSQPENNYPEVTDDAPTADEALGVDLPPNGSNYAMWVPQGCAEDYPERYQELVDAVEAATNDEDYLANLEELGEAGKVEYLAPDELETLTQDSVAEIEGVLEGDPEAFTE